MEFRTTRSLQETLQTIVKQKRVELWLVGGAVRDKLLRRPSTDLDLVCLQASRVAKDVAKALSGKYILLDKENRIYRVILPTTYAPVSTLDFAELQGTSIVQDLSRRDFTINAMAKAFPDGPLIDPLNGLKDLKRRSLRSVSKKAFLEDPLRLLRTFRFQAQLQFKIDAATRREVAKSCAKISSVACERIRHELLLLLASANATPAIQEMDNVGLLTHLVPELEACRRTAVRYYKRGGVLKHQIATVRAFEWLLTNLRVKGSSRSIIHPAAHKRMMEYLEQLAGGFPRHAWLKLAGLVHDIGKPATAKMIKGRLRFFEHEVVGAEMALARCQHLRFSRQEAQGIALWVRHHMRLGSLADSGQPSDKAVSRFFRQLGVEGIGMCLVSLADHFTYVQPKQWGRNTDPVERLCRKMLATYYQNEARVLPARIVDGHQLIQALSLEPGPIIGELLEAIQDAQVEGKIHSLPGAIDFARDYLGKRKSVKPTAVEVSPKRGPNPQV